MLTNLGKPAIKKEKMHLSQEAREMRNFKNALLLVTRANSIFADTPMHRFYKLNEKNVKK